MRREETRRQRYDKKFKTAKKYPISLCAINFRVDDNFGHLIRSGACFGADRIYIIGHLPSRADIKGSSGSLYDYITIEQFSTPREFVTKMQNRGIKIIAAELVTGAIPLDSYNFNFDCDVCLVVGNEQTGIPPEILASSDILYIRMPGPGYCLNTAQTANIVLYEAIRQYEGQRLVSLSPTTY